MRLTTYDDLSLTTREHDVLRRLAGGVSDAVICRELRIRPADLDYHVARLQRKLGARGRYALTVIYRQRFAE